MNIEVKVHPGSSQEKIGVLDDGGLEVWLKAKAIDGKANEVLLKMLKKYFGKEVKIKSGLAGRRKVVGVGG